MNEPSSWPLWIAAGAFVLVAGGAAAGWLLWRRHRRDRLAALAESLGFAFEAGPREGLAADEVAAARPFELWRNADWEAVARLRGRFRGYDVRVFDLRGDPFARSDDGESPVRFRSAELTLTAVCATGAATTLPKVLLVPRHRVTRWVKGRREPDVPFGDRFSERYRVVTDEDPETARALLTEPIRERLARNRDWTIDIAEDGVLVYRFDRTIPVKQLEAAIEETVELLLMLG